MTVAVYFLILFAADIGGTMGLLIGASVMTLFEFIDVILQNVFMIYFTPKEKKNITETMSGVRL